MTTYNIGAPAEKIVAVTLDLSGVILSTVRDRSGSGAPLAIIDCSTRRLALGAEMDFTARVDPGHSGVIEIVAVALHAPAPTMLPIGSDHPFLESELPPSPGADGAHSQSESIRFCFAASVLRWTAENLTGLLELTDRMPKVTVALHLPAGNEGGLHFHTLAGASPSP